MMRARRISKPAYPIPGAKVCDECERPKKIKRNHAGKSYCDACYKRGFTHMPCAGCGETCVAKRGTVVPYCQACETAHRLCKGCGRHVPRAGMYHEGQVVCPSCVPKYKAKVPCPNCGKLSSRLSRIGGEGEAICDGCRNEQDHATCGTCGRYRKRAAEEAGRPICVECVDGTTHTCPDCQEDVPGGGTSRCRDCAAKTRGRVRVDVGCGAIIQPWVRDLFLGHCEADLLAAPRGDVVKRIDAAAAFFATMDKSMTGQAAVTPEALLEVYGPERLRRASKAVSFVTRALAIAWSPRVIEDFAERRRIQHMLDEVACRPWGGEMAAYASNLLSEKRQRPLRLQTVRMYLRAALSLMEHSNKQALSDIIAEDCRRFLKRHPGHRACLTPFQSWSAVPVDSPSHPDAPRHSKVREIALKSKAAAILSALDATASRPAATALIAALISTIYGHPLRSVVELRGRDFSHDGKLRLGADEIRLDGKVTTALKKWLTWTSDDKLIFASTRRTGPLSLSVIAYHVKAATNG
jgi:hypothetical protein